MTAPAALRALLTVVALTVATVATATAMEIPTDPSATEATAVCPVCRVREGTTQAEDVRATRTVGGAVYGFCSEACADEFDRGTARYLAIADSLRAHPSEPPRGTGFFDTPIPRATPT